MTGRIVITGAGVVSAIGSDKDKTLESLIASRSGIGTLRHLKTSLSDLEAVDTKSEEGLLRNSESARKSAGLLSLE